ncbi:hypothetical protein QBC47DRAFT_377786 [Echria macrotheca]|uniref:Uncharacterized protein n=1 Tax=Echria macrotheca TaxID=438768 RepID=A0AAJ0FAZ7_9PEZI|nr:hypothetical protein QBC47DRAFT_377786 [Echria macrotheca]
MPERYERGCWPTLMVGAGPDEWWWSASGFSLDMARWLRNDMARWFYLSKHEVKIVLLLRKEAGDMFVMEKWEEDDANMPVCRQTITIFRDSETEPGSWDVVGGPLVLSFGLLFSRDPMPGSREGVFVVDEEALRKYADCVWQRCCAKTETELLCDQMEGLNTD